MNFREAEAYLYSLGNEVEAMKLGLENITALLDRLGEPHLNYMKVQVAGTNGKGSVCAFLNSICLQAGIKTGLYTSPHLVSITERIRIDGSDISEAEFARIATLVRAKAEELLSGRRLEYRPTFFEQVTAIALVAFAEGGVGLAILETGLGGRYDAVTAARAEIAAITRVDIDHQEYLGNTLAEIAAEKAAIIRPDSRVVALHQSREAEQAIIGRCRQVGVEPRWATRDIVVASVDEDPEYKFHVFTFKTGKTSYARIEPLMRGRHQAENAAVAIAIAETLQEAGFAITDLEIDIGLHTAEHPGRLERIGNFLLDGAHNPGGARALAAYLDEFVDRPITLIFGAMKDKDVREIAEILFPRADHIILTQPGNTRALDVDRLTKVATKIVDQRSIHAVASVTEAIGKAQSLAPAGGVILVTGSLYLVGEVRGILKPSQSI